jgi:hypothetical protein
VTDGYNSLSRHPHIPDVDWIAFTDGYPDPRSGWETRAIEVAPGVTPRMAAKWFKVLPHIVLPAYERTIWVDGTVRVDSPGFVAAALDCVNESGLALWRHPERDDVYSEALVSLEMPKYRDEPILNQIAHYYDNGHPLHWGLWACGVLARVNAYSVAQLMENWWDEIEAWSVQDQLSFAYCLWALDMNPGEFPGNLYSNPWLTVTGHNPRR